MELPQSVFETSFRKNTYQILNDNLMTMEELS